MQDDFPDGVDYTFDAVGDPETTKTAFRWTRNGGLCVIVGLPAPARGSSWIPRSSSGARSG